MITVLKRAHDYIATYGLLAILLVIIIGWTVPGLILLGPLPRRWRRAAARYAIMAGLRLYIGMLTSAGVFRLELEALDTLRGGPPVILTPNHPTSIDAFLLLSRHPDLACILKPELMGSPFLGAAARLAGFIRSDPPRRMIREAVAQLRRGGLVLLFPEGTRTTRSPLNPLKGSAEVIARLARVPIQVAIIEADSPYLSKGWPILKVPRLPIRFRVRLGSRLEPAAEGTGGTQALEQALTRELVGAPQNGWLGRAA
ncbi:MAG: lysophospholipid acyltransferase family protein [Steroidobacteraceae bacterium]